MKSANADAKETPKTATELTEITTQQKVISRVRGKIEELEVKDDATMSDANKGRTYVLTLLDRIEAVRLKLVKPLNDHVKMINTQCKQASVPLNEALDVLDGKMLAYRRLIQAKADEEARKVAEENRKKQEAYEKKLEKAKDPERVKPPQLSDPIREAPAKTVDNTQFSKQTVFEVTDATKVPEKYKAVDPSLIRKDVQYAVKAGTIATLVIPGVRIYETESIRTNRR